MDRKTIINRFESKMPMVFVRFYAVGLLLFMLPYTRPLFISITSLSLLLTIAAVFYFHRQWNARTVLWFAFIAVSSFFLEMEGVHSGKLFGSYYYERGLAPLVSGTPLIIGLNWLFLVYGSHAIISRYSNSPWIRIFLGSLLMIAYDVVLEWVAPAMRMWHFDGGYPSMQNFLVWFAAALVYHTGFVLFGIRTDNMPARALFLIQIAFFIIIGLFSLIFIK